MAPTLTASPSNLLAAQLCSTFSHSVGRAEFRRWHARRNIGGDTRQWQCCIHKHQFTMFLATDMKRSKIGFTLFNSPTSTAVQIFAQFYFLHRTLLLAWFFTAGFISRGKRKSKERLGRGAQPPWRHSTTRCTSRSAGTPIAGRWTDLEQREGGDMSRHVTAKFDADADADFANEYNLRQI